MVNISTRMRKLNTKLLSIRLGPGAAILPQNVTRLQMEMGTKIDGGHRGGRKFWRTMLPRLAYHNPSIPMTVRRSDDPATPSKLSIFTSTASPSQSNQPKDAQAEAPPEEVRTIDMRMKQESAILDELMHITGAKQVEPTAEEVEMLRELEEQRVRSRKDSVRSKAFRAELKKEAKMLQAARDGAL